LSRKSDKEQPEVTAEGTLGPQMGTDTVDLVQGRYDPLILSKLGPLAKYWISYFMLVPAHRGGNFYQNFCKMYVRTARSEEGWQQNKFIQFTAGAKGAPTVGELMKKPNVLSRNITHRDWKKEAEEEGKVVVE
jgi:hypothetical protein